MITLFLYCALRVYVRCKRLTNTLLHYISTDHADLNGILIISTYRYRMAYIQCGGDPTLIHAENSFQQSGDRVVFISGVIVDVTTINDDGSESHQTHAISYATFSEVWNVISLTRTWVCLSVIICGCECKYVKRRECFQEYVRMYNYNCSLLNLRKCMSRLCHCMRA